MTDFVNPPVPPHVANLLGAVFSRFNAAFSGEEWAGLRASHFRIVEAVGREGARGTDLAARLGMTKQGAGQLAAGLVEGGWMSQEPDPLDGRARRLELTPRGLELLERLEARIEAVEAEWAAEVGAAEYAAFRDVLGRLARRPAREAGGRGSTVVG